MASLGALFAAARRRRPALDHLVRLIGRYNADAGDRLAAAVTYYWFLSLFPILLLAISVLGYVYGDQTQAKVNQALGGVLPAPLVTTIGDTLAQAKGPAGVVGLLGTLYSGLGWIDALREAIRTIWHQNVSAGNIVVRKLVDVVVLVGLVATVAASVAVTGLTTAAGGFLLELLDVEQTSAARLATRLAGIGATLVADLLLFLYLFGRLPRVATPLRRVLQGALLGAVAFEVLKRVGVFYVERTTTKGQATYGTFAVVVGLLLFLNLFSRLLLLTAAWIVTAPYDSDVPPSGTASPEMARRSGIPEHFADPDPDQPPTTQPGGAPAPLKAARSTLPQASAVPAAAHIGVGAGATLLAGVVWHALRTLRDLLRR